MNNSGYKKYLNQTSKQVDPCFSTILLEFQLDQVKLHIFDVIIFISISDKIIKIKFETLI